jgi:hypothetical protein
MMDLVELIATPGTTITLPGDAVATLLETLKETTAQRETYRLTAESQEENLKALAKKFTASEQDKVALSKQVQELTRALEEAKKPPVTVPPPPIPHPIPRPPVISKTEISGLFALTIEKGKKEPTDAMYADVRTVLMKAKGMGFNAWRGFFNIDEVREHLARKASDPKHLPQYGRSLGIDFIADTVDAMMPKLDVNGQREYLKGLEAMGAMAVVFNDANQYETLDLIEWTDAVRRVLPNMPIIASLRGNGRISEYPMFDLFEAQTFGKEEELLTFLDRPFNIFCLDARKSISAEGITTRAAIVLAREEKLKAFFYYTDLASDWLTMPLDKQQAIRKMIENHRAAR